MPSTMRTLFMGRQRGLRLSTATVRSTFAVETGRARRGRSPRRQETTNRLTAVFCPYTTEPPIRGRSGFPVLSPGAPSHYAPSTHTPTTCQWFQVLLADILGKVCLGGHSPLGYARFL